jgi:lysophospholipase L1-like esterase
MRQFSCRLFLLAATGLLLAACTSVGAPKTKPTLWLIGDSTVKNGHEDGSGNMWSWGTVIKYHFDTKRINVVNKALGGTSSRSFWQRGLWKAVIDQAKPGDYVIMQFGHNDGGRTYNDAKARASVPGIGDNTVDTTLVNGQQESVHAYGWYLRQYVAQAQATGVTPIICSLIPRNDWRDGKVARNQKDTYVKWAREVAEQTHAYFIDLNNRVADKYDKMGQEAVKPFFPNEHTHTSWGGAVINAETVVEGIRSLQGPRALASRLGLKPRQGCNLADYLVANPKVPQEAPIKSAQQGPARPGDVSRMADPALFPPPAGAPKAQ